MSWSNASVDSKGSKVSSSGRICTGGSGTSGICTGDCETCRICIGGYGTCDTGICTCSGTSRICTGDCGTYDTGICTGDCGTCGICTGAIGSSGRLETRHMTGVMRTRILGRDFSSKGPFSPVHESG
ncbi:hypothetical protein TNCV_1922601 [Trichonephila clavipes]|nr:hypothetical protein TNCV_1922601 [Trichonephila clavipes]